MTALLVAALICFIIAGLMFGPLSKSNSDGDLGMGMLFLLVLTIGIVLLVVAAGVYLWHHMSVGWT